VTTDTMLRVVDTCTQHLLDALSDFTDAQAREPSLLPGWSRGHVLTHVARNADGLVNLLTWAETGDRMPMYPSRDVRDADIESGAGRPAAELRDDVAASAARLHDHVQRLDAEAWERTIEWGSGTPRSAPASFVPVLRAAELELHHTDLDLGHPPAEWPVDLVTVFLPYAADDLAARAGETLTLQATDTWATLQCRLTEGDEPGAAARTVEGPHTALTAWVTGRSDGGDLVVVPEGGLPEIGDWR
jgi:maleylpyruvate isomerase